MTPAVGKSAALIILLIALIPACQRRAALDLRPGTVAVMPVVNRTGHPLKYPEDYRILRPRARLAVLTAFREEIQERLIRRGFSPLPTDLVDARLEEISPRERDDRKRVARSLGADALLYVTVTRWDSSHMLTSLALMMGGKASLIEARSGEPLWAHRLDRRRVRVMNVNLGRNYRTYVRRFVAELLEGLN